MKRLLFSLAFFLSAVGSIAAADSLPVVVGVHDGDSITVLQDKHEIKIRLEGIDAPELGQPFGAAAKKALSDLVFQKPVRIEERGKDRYGRTLANVFVDGKRVNLALVESGFAWHFVRYSKAAEYRDAEQRARAARRGLWNDKSPVPPWDWRKKPKASK